MSRQTKTGNITEERVRNKFMSMGLDVEKPIPDRGIDFIVRKPQSPQKALKVQVKGRGKNQTSNRFRWFQIRTTKKQRDETIVEGYPVNEAWRKKVSLVDIFIFVSEKFDEYWIFTPKEVENIVIINQEKYGSRKDNQKGLQAELDLDVLKNNIPLTEIYIKNLNNWDLITNLLL